MTTPDPNLASMRASAVEAARAELDLSRSATVMAFGVKVQRDLQLVSQSLVACLRTADSAAADEALRAVVDALRGFEDEESNPKSHRSWWGRRLPVLGRKLWERPVPLAQTLWRVEALQAQVDALRETLVEHERQLLRTLRSLDVISAKVLAFLDDLNAHIEAGQITLAELDSEILPARSEELGAASSERQPVLAAALRDLRGARDSLERRIRDLKLTCQLARQSLAAFQTIQENNRTLTLRIRSMLTDTLELWEPQAVQAQILDRAREASLGQRTASGVVQEFDAVAVRAANAEALTAVEDSLAMAMEHGSEQRAAEAEIAALERHLQHVLASAATRSAD
ncbi:toxic anion resistance protein [Rubellimicrobium mesophilum]|nr:toxic anion resistance protein [Rubellimicrobium mesophilum]